MMTSGASQEYRDLGAIMVTNVVLVCAWHKDCHTTKQMSLCFS